MTGSLRVWITAGCLGIVCLGLAGVSGYFGLNVALRREADAIGLGWARHIEYQLPKVAGAVSEDGSFEPGSLPDPDGFRELLTDVFAVGSIYQFDYINRDCLCHLTLTSSAGIDVSHGHTVGDPADLFGEHSHDHGFTRAGHEMVTAVGGLPMGALKHVLHSEVVHENPGSNPSDAYRHPVDRKLVRDIVVNGGGLTRILRGSEPDQPSTFAEVYHPVFRDGDVAYLLRVLVNVEAQATRYAKFLAGAGGASLAFLLVAVGYPTRRYVQTARQHSELDQQARFLANHDVLTQLFNRNNFTETVHDILWRCLERKKSALLFVFDLNDFKEVNDYYGHQIGDELLCAFAELLRDRVPENAYVARLGGDEFVVVIPDIDEANPDHREYLTMPQALRMQVCDGRQTVKAGIAGGAAVYPRDAGDLSELIQNADLALYAAKPNRAGEVRAYDARMKSDLHDRLDLRTEFRKALDDGRIEPWYQPIVDFQTGVTVGFEALARWRDPERGLLTPAAFKSVFEDPELCGRLGQVMFERVTSDMAVWQDAGVPFGTVSMNVVDGDLKRPGFVSDILAGLQDRGIAPERFVIEVTENCLFGANKTKFVGRLTELRDAGCMIALDDFGTGYSSITQLKELPINVIKIDRSFIRNILDSSDDQVIVAALREIAKSMKLRIVLEGIETKAQEEFLQKMDFELGQGFLFSRPVAACDVPGMFVDGAVGRRSGSLH